MNQLVNWLAKALVYITLALLFASVLYAAYRIYSHCDSCQVLLVARDDQAQLALDEELRIDVLHNDSGKGALSIDWVGPPSRGVATIESGVVVYRSGAPCGLDTFRYQVRDQQPATAQAQVTIVAKPLDSSFVELTGLDPFVFGRAELTDRGKCLIQRLAERLAVTRPRGSEEVWFTGHTCVIGSERFNNGLAMARARVARDHLMKLLTELNASEWITRMKDPKGEGSKRPKPETAKCSLIKRNPAELEKCLAPNRRVVVEVR